MVIKTHKCRSIIKLIIFKILCLQGEFIIDVISEGAAMAISECLMQFKDRRWNCTTFDTTDVFGNILSLGNCHHCIVSVLYNC